METFCRVEGVTDSALVTLKPPADQIQAFLKEEQNRGPTAAASTSAALAWMAKQLSVFSEHWSQILQDAITRCVCRIPEGHITRTAWSYSARHVVQFERLAISYGDEFNRDKSRQRFHVLRGIALMAWISCVATMRMGHVGRLSLATTWGKSHHSKSVAGEARVRDSG